MTPVVSATSWLHAAASSRRSLPTASSSARSPPSSAFRPARLNSPRRKSSRSPNRLTGGQSTRLAPPLTRLASSCLFLAPPEWVRTSTTSGPGWAAWRASSAATSLMASCMDLTMTRHPPPNSDGAVSPVRSPGLRSAARTSCTSGAPGSPSAGSAASAAPAAVTCATTACTARSTSSSSSPTITVTAAGGWSRAGAAEPERGMPAACQKPPPGRDTVRGGPVFSTGRPRPRAAPGRCGPG
jgi:hypothetical protein